MSASTKMVVESVTLRARDFTASGGNVDLGVVFYGMHGEQELRSFGIRPEGEGRYADIEAAACAIIEFPRNDADTDDDAYAVDGPDFFRSQLRIAAGDRDDCLVVQAPCPVYELTGFSLAEARDRTGIDNIKISGLIKGHDFIPFFLEQPLHAFCFKLIDLAPQGR